MKQFVKAFPKAGYCSNYTHRFFPRMSNEKQKAIIFEVLLLKFESS